MSLSTGPMTVKGAISGNIEFTPYGKLFLEVHDLLDRVTEAGFVLTVELVPDPPLAMGRYHHQATLRLARRVYSQEKKQ